MNDKLNVGNNNDGKLANATNDPNLKNYFTFSLGEDFFKPCASYLLKEKPENY